MQRAALRQEKLNYLSKSLISPLGHQCAASDTPIQPANELWMNWADVPNSLERHTEQPQVGPQLQPRVFVKDPTARMRPFTLKSTRDVQNLQTQQQQQQQKTPATFRHSNPEILQIR